MTVGLMKADTDVILNVAQKIIKQNNQMQEEFNKLKIRFQRYIVLGIVLLLIK
ncbi:hypothetical protein SD457_11585 [Coprobacillaceae bacterium CR2/5/TPMF4]|nr:hypothetical protein SD457_11585 [Coprobacillaceae bacterium CR2/5/TPMF4]